MEPLTDAQSARYSAELELMAATLDDYSTHLVEASEQMPLPTLLVSLGPDDEERDRLLGISIMPFGDDEFASSEFVQFYVRLPFSAEGEHHQDVLAATAIVNTSLAVGHFAVRGDEIYYRYVLTVPTSSGVDGDMLAELVPLLDFHQEQFGDYLEGVAEGEIALAVLPEVIQRTTAD